ncbi:hypothetical protein lerEdw1_010767 [Lerista edwardsae]|nr:hypothetical protein lerEdw1_010767 [Lerista edwardsae]
MLNRHSVPRRCLQSKPSAPGTTTPDMPRSHLHHNASGLQHLSQLRRRHRCWEERTLLEGMRRRHQREYAPTLQESWDFEDEYRRISNDVSNRILMHVRDSSGWKEIKHGKNVSVSMKNSMDYSGHIYRVEALMEVPAEKLFPFIHLPEYRSKWDKGLQQYKIVEVIDQDTSIVHSITHSYGLGLVSPRDFVFIVHIKRYEGNLMTTNSISIEHPKYPPTSQYVRGTSFPCGYAVHPVPGNPGQCKFVAILQVDLGGMLRPAVIDSAMPNSLINLITDCRAGIKSLKTY